jgi:hypothetical protein
MLSIPKGVSKILLALIYSTVILSSPFTNLAHTSPNEPWAQEQIDAANGIPRLSPSVFKELPTDIVKVLVEQNCMIPQSTYSKQPNNVISGEFAKPEQVDWAVLCSIDGNSFVQVFWDASATNFEKVTGTLSPDWRWSSGIPGNYNFFREIGLAQYDYIINAYEFFGGPQPPQLNHKGINDIYEKASIVYYWHEGKWLELAGSD